MLLLEKKEGKNERNQLQTKSDCLIRFAVTVVVVLLYTEGDLTNCEGG